MTPSPFVVEEMSVEVEHSRREGVSWRTLTSADRTPSDALTSGICEIQPGGTLALHRHAPAEVYYILDGTGIVTLSEHGRAVGPGATIFIPGGTPHAFRNTGRSVLRFFYVFPVDSYGDVEYVMLD
jgi:mannose-6-phosphate isomerase-like protein (cupin superfamily)